MTREQKWDALWAAAVGVMATYDVYRGPDMARPAPGLFPWLDRLDERCANLKRVIDEICPDPRADQLLADFKRHGNRASEHLADDSGREWDAGYKAKAEALAIFDAHPELHTEMREIAKGFLWTLRHDRPPQDGAQ